MVQDDIQQRLDEGCAIAERLGQELAIAESSWAHFEAINGETNETRRQFLEATNWLLVSYKGLLSAVVRDTLMALCRCVDDSTSLSLSKVAKLLKDESLRTALIEHARAKAPRFHENDNFYANYEADQCSAKIELIRRCVPIQWNRAPAIATLYSWRKAVEPLRHKILAHSGDREGIAQPEVNQIRAGHSLISELVRASQRIFCGSALNDTLRQHIRSANIFWDHAEVGFIEAAERDMHGTTDGQTLGFGARPQGAQESRKECNHRLE